MKLLTISFAIIAYCQLLVVSCKDTPQRRPAKTQRKTELRFELISPKNGQSFTDAQTLNIHLRQTQDTTKYDTCSLHVDGKFLSSFAGFFTDIDLRSIKMGTRRMSLHFYASGQLIETLQFAVKIVPSAPPKQYTCQVVNTYPHDEQSYTQGLFFHEGYIYEGTGQYGASTLSKRELTTAKPLRSIALDQKLFGEGICLHQGKIYQLTWTNHKGFIYDLETFELRNQFEYTTEGWGIASDNATLWMSDGTANIYAIDPLTMSVIDQIEVWTPDGRIDNINELEFIENELWANVYTEDYIIRIDPLTGRVTRKIDLSNLLPKELRKPSTDVLNGIAYDKAQKRIFVTGKNWARLFEIKLKELQK